MGANEKVTATFHLENGPTSTNLRRWLDQAESKLANCQEERDAAVAELAELARWKEGALIVMAGLHDLGVALEVPLGHRISGPGTIELALAVVAERDAALAKLTEVRLLVDGAILQITQDGGYIGDAVIPALEVERAIRGTNTTPPAASTEGSDQ